ncbi:craniofacial development protein 2-like protein [Plakobranchus ocellatus]|uniref:Craniofacial development protein 2-like protein n=1 Tax=Plakobranchus ocellatus TaxID=259542 RepID=A0AAV3XVA4_9GAST|nr:craniofacial development protein 2-like protein [Plakobranchus ocellatus]
MEKAKGYVKSQWIIIVMGDFDANVGDERVEDVVGHSGIGTVNDRGSEFTITNTWYQNHPRRLWTWMSPRDRNRNKIDYILIQKRFRNAVKISKSLPGADGDSDHIPVVF